VALLPNADLYINKIDFNRYLDQNDCVQCGFPSCDSFIDAIKRGEKLPQECSFIGRNKAYAFEAVKKIEESWPEVPLLTHPRSAFTGLVELNQPDERSLTLISGNNEYTEQVLLTVLGTTICPFFLLFVDTDGNTVDMSMIYKTLTAEGIHNALKKAGLEHKVTAKDIILPGLASSLKYEVEALSGWNVRVGPVCAAELPLFLSDIWIRP
jgi:CO dehydrogenase/acetyl-CoA synthase gamma subunit (corrinoid Fe-S protein)